MQMSDSAPKKKRIGFFSKIESRDDALKVVEEASYAFFLLAAMLAVFSYLIGSQSFFVDAAIEVVIGGFFLAAIYVIGGFFLLRFKSRAAAVTLLLLALGEAVVTLFNLFGHDLGGGRNVVLAAIVVWAAIRAVDATFKLRGRFSASRPGESPGV